MGRREEEEIHASANDAVFACDITFTDNRATWRGRGDTIAEAIAAAFSHAAAMTCGCGEYAVEVFAEVHE